MKRNENLEPFALLTGCAVDSFAGAVWPGQG